MRTLRFCEKINQNAVKSPTKFTHELAIKRFDTAIKIITKHMCKIYMLYSLINKHVYYHNVDGMLPSYSLIYYPASIHTICALGNSQMKTATKELD